MNRTLLTVVAALAAASVAAQDLSKSHKRWIEKDVAAIATRKEAQLFRDLPTDADRDQFQEIFWIRRDPNLRTSKNEFRQEFEERIEIANERLQGRVGPGSLTDMGQLFLLLGFPIDMSSGRGSVSEGLPEQRTAPDGSTSEGNPAAGTSSTPRFQTWHYPNGLDIQFRSQRGYGYRLVESEGLDEILDSRRQALVANPLIDYELDAAGNLLPPAIPTEAGRTAELLDTLIETKGTSDALSFRVTPGFFRSHEGTTYVPILFELDGDALEQSDGRVDVSLFGAIEGSDGELVQRFEESAELSADEHVRFEIPLEAPPGDYTIYLGVLDEKAGTTGSRVSGVQVPSLRGEGIMLSSVVLYDQAEKTAEPAGTPGRAFQFAGVKLEPIGSGVFRPSDTLGIFFYAYGAGGTDVTARYVFYKDGEEKAQTRPQALLAVEGVALASDEIPLESFEPGAYRLLVRVEDKTTGEVVEERASFTLEP